MSYRWQAARLSTLTDVHREIDIIDMLLDLITNLLNVHTLINIFN